MILTEWDLKSTYAPDSSPEWTIQSSSQMSTMLPLAHKLYNDTVAGVLVNPTSSYLDGLEFESLPTSNQTETIQVSIEANNNGSGNVYVIDGTQKKSIILEVGKTYVFNHSTAHPFRFSTTSNGTHGGGTEYTDGVTKTSGSTTITISASTPSPLYYYCSIHSGMGGTITIGEEDGY
jgi:plastocyanin